MDGLSEKQVARMKSNREHALRAKQKHKVSVALLEKANAALVSRAAAQPAVRPGGALVVFICTVTLAG